MYILDTNVFIQAKNFYYGFDIVPAFWDWLDEKQENGQIASIKPVYDELLNVCKSFSVSYINTFDLMRELGAKF